MKTPIFATNTVPSNSATNYSSLHNVGLGTPGWNASETAGSICQAAGSITSIIIKVPTAPGSGKSWAITLRVNGSDSSLSATLSNTDTTVTATGNVSISANNKLTLKCVPSGTPTSPTYFAVSHTFESTSSAESPMFGEFNADFNSGYEIMPHGYGGTSGLRGVCPTAGVISNLRLYADTAQAVGESGVATIYKNGSATSLTVTVNNSNQEAEDSTHTVTFAAGEELSMGFTHFGGSTFVNYRWGYKWSPTVDGEAIFVGTHGVDTYSSAEYDRLYARSAGAETATESTKKLVVPFDATWQTLYINTNTAPGAGNSITYTSRQDGSNGALSAQITGTNTTGSDTSNTVSLSTGNEIDFQKTNSVTVNAYTYVRFGVVIYLSPGGGGGGVTTPIDNANFSRRGKGRTLPTPVTIGH